jgi:hypothetical protein
MTNEEILQKTLTMTLERIAKQAMSYETEIANLNAQLIMLANQEEEKKTRSRATKADNQEDS